MSSDRASDRLYESEAALRLVSRELTELTPAVSDDKDEWVRGERTAPFARRQPTGRTDALRAAHDEVLVGLELLRHSLRLLDQSSAVSAPGSAGAVADGRNVADAVLMARDVELRLVTLQGLLDQILLDDAAADSRRTGVAGR